MTARAALTWLTALLASGCASAPPSREVPQATTIPIPIACAPDVERPALVTDDELRAMTSYQRYLALYRDRLQRRQYELELEAALAGCRTLPVPWISDPDRSGERQLEPLAEGLERAR